MGPVEAPERRENDPLASLEEKLRALWREILEIPEFGIDDTLFDLGGESISATLCANRIESMFAVRIPVSILLDERTTVRSLAAQIETLILSVGRPAIS